MCGQINPHFKFMRFILVYYHMVFSMSLQSWRYDSVRIICLESTLPCMLVPCDVCGAGSDIWAQWLSMVFCAMCRMKFQHVSFTTNCAHWWKMFWTLMIAGSKRWMKHSLYDGDSSLSMRGSIASNGTVIRRMTRKLLKNTNISWGRQSGMTPYTCDMNMSKSG